MFHKLMKKLKDQDQFGYNPSSAIIFNKRSVFQTVQGAVATVLLFALFAVMWYQNLAQMFSYKGNSIQENNTTADLKAIGKVKLSDMKTLPFVAPYYKGALVPRTSMKMCGEFGGDCFQFVNKYKKYEWINRYCESEFAECTNEVYESHVCTPNEISQTHFDTGRLYMCPPADKL